MKAGRQEEEESPLIISVEELQKMKKIGPECTLIDARQRKNFEKQHIPGAVNVDLYIYHWADTSSGGLEAFADQLTKLFVWAGVRKERLVVFYDNTSGMYAARGVWLLRYLGHKNVSMLDGGLRAWQRRGLKTESGTVSLRAGRFSPSVREDLMASKDYIMQRLRDPSSSSFQLVDTRERKEWTGELVRGARGGHIPGALNKDWRRNLGRDGRFKALEKLRAMYADLGLDGEKEVITYCQGGYRAANSFVVLSMLGYRVRTYLGSWNEWSNQPGAPVER